MNDALRDEIRKLLHFEPAPNAPSVEVRAEVRESDHVRKLVAYAAPDGELIEAFLFEPLESRARSGVVFLHQHNSEWEIGKSEIAGLAGDPLQAFGPALARAGVTVLAPDLLGFESRRIAFAGDTRLAPPITRPHGNAEGWVQYYNHAMHRLVRGELLLSKILADVSAAVTSLAALANVERVGLAGHSHGGNITLIAAGLDERVAFACASGAACSYRYKLANGVPLEMSLVVPGFAARFDLDDLMRCTAPRRLFIVSSDADPYSADAEALVSAAKPVFPAGALDHLRVAGPHALDRRRFEAIVAWLVSAA